MVRLYHAVPATQGKYGEAGPLYERCQAIEEKVLGPEHPSLATTLGNRARLLESLVSAVGYDQECCEGLFRFD